MRLYSFFRSTACFRVRIALALKGLTCETIPINLLQGEGEHQAPAFAEINPQRMLPVLVTDDGERITQSLAICEYLEDLRPAPPLLPASPSKRAYVRALAAAMASDIHPLHAIRVSRYLERAFDADAQARRAWGQHWIREGLLAIEASLKRGGHTGRYCCGDEISLADVFLVPQLASAIHYGVAIDDLELVGQIVGRCLEQPAFQAALPEKQPEAA